MGAIVGGVLGGIIPSAVENLDTNQKLPDWAGDTIPAVVGLALVLASGTGRPGLAAAGAGMLAVAAGKLAADTFDGIWNIGEVLQGQETISTTNSAARFAAFQRAKAAQSTGRNMPANSNLSPNNKNTSSRSEVLAMAEALECN